MKITHIIGLDTLGSDNTNDDNLRFAIAVKTAISNEYPDADVIVELGEFSRTDSDDCEIAENVNIISNLVWNNADY